MWGLIVAYGLLVASVIILLNVQTTVLKTEEYTVIEKGFSTHIYLSDTIESPEKYSELIQYIIQNSNKSDITVYLAGYGGSVATTTQLLLAMKESGTTFHAVVYGDVYSAHAVLATNMNDIRVVKKGVLFLFHRPAFEFNGENHLMKDMCSLIPEENKDRGVSARNKCVNYVDASEKSFTEMFMQVPFSLMSDEEKERYMAGDDVIITGERTNG